MRHDESARAVQYFFFFFFLISKSSTILIIMKFVRIIVNQLNSSYLMSLSFWDY